MEPVPNKLIRVAVVENDPLRFVGFRALFDGDSGFVLQTYTLINLNLEVTTSF